MTSDISTHKMNTEYTPANNESYVKPEVKSDRSPEDSLRKTGLSAEGIVEKNIRVQTVCISTKAPTPTVKIHLNIDSIQKRDSFHDLNRELKK